MPPELAEDSVLEETRCVDLVLGYACDAACGFCSQERAWRRRPAMDLGSAAAWALRAWRQGYRRLGLSGGEPTLYPKLENLIRVARRVGFRSIRLQTNGLRLAEPALARRLAEAGLSMVRLSLHGPAEVHDRLLGVDGAFGNALRALENARGLGLRVGVNVVLNAENAARLPELCDALLGRGVSNLMLIQPLYEGEMAAQAHRLGAPMRELLPAVRKAVARFEAEGLEPPLLLHFTPCLLPGYEGRMLGWYRFSALAVEADGAAHDLDASAGEGKALPPGCAGCAYAPRCPGVDKGYLRRFGAAEFVPMAERAPSRLRGVSEEPGRMVLTENERCALALVQGGPLTTGELLSRSAEAPLCQDCRGGSAILEAAERLARMGRLKRERGGGRYRWSLQG